jgi:hemolysin III
MLFRISRNEQISFYVHFAGFFAGIAGFFALTAQTTGLPGTRAVSIIYASSFIFLFASSSLYHYTKRVENGESFWRKLDHLAIFIMIAGTYTPFCYIYLGGAWKWSIIIIQWSLVGVGFFFKFFFINAPRRLNTAIYLAMGWIVIIPIKQFASAAPVYITVLLALGGLFYTVGAFIYSRKWPNPKPGFFGFHEIFHIFILLGAFSHYAGIYLSVR